MMLLKPYTLGDLALKNRIALAPLTRGRSNANGTPNEHNLLHYKQRATFGLLITEGTQVSKQATGWDQAPCIYNDEHVAGWSPITKAVHEEGGVIFCQLWHLGRVSHSSFHGLQPVSASAIKCDGKSQSPNGARPEYETPRAMTPEDIEHCVAEWRSAAACAKAAGFDGVEIHSANGYLLDQFLQSCTNQRDDGYGGSIQNRSKLLKEVVAAVCEVFPSSRVGVRLSPNGNFNCMGSSDNFDTFSYVIAELDKMNLGYLHLCDGLAFGYHEKCPVFRLYDARKLFSNCIIGSTGYSKDTAEGALGTGVVDMIAFGRITLSNPDLPARFEKGLPLAEMAPYELWWNYPEDKGPAEGYNTFGAYSQEGQP